MSVGHLMESGECGNRHGRSTQRGYHDVPQYRRRLRSSVFKVFLSPSLFTPLPFITESHPCRLFESMLQGARSLALTLAPLGLQHT